MKSQFHSVSVSKSYIAIGHISISQFISAAVSAPTASSNPETFDVPANWNITNIEVKNDLNNLFEDCSVEFTASDVTHSDAGGASVQYTRYSCNLGYDMASRTIRIKWS